MKLSTPLSDAGKLYANYASRLEKLDIFTLRDLLYHLPTRYDDYSRITKIADAPIGEVVTIQGQITSMTNNYTRSHKQIQKATITDDSGSLPIIWFNQPYIAKTLKFGDMIAVAGRVQSDGFLPQLTAPDFEVI